jgi:hypothetical protein
VTCAIRDTAADGLGCERSFVSDLRRRRIARKGTEERRAVASGRDIYAITAPLGRGGATSRGRPGQPLASLHPERFSTRETS